RRCEVVETDERKRFVRAPALGAARAPPPGQAAERAHQGHVERGHGIVEARPLGLGDGAATSADPDRAAKRLELPQQDPEEGGLAAAVRSEDRYPAAWPAREPYVLGPGRAPIARH